MQRVFNEGKSLRERQRAREKGVRKKEGYVCEKERQTERETETEGERGEREGESRGKKRNEERKIRGEGIGAKRNTGVKGLSEKQLPGKCILNTSLYPCSRAHTHTHTHTYTHTLAFC